MQSGGSEEAASLMEMSQLLDALTKVMLKQTENSDDEEVQNKTEQSELTEIRLKELALEDQRMKTRLTREKLKWNCVKPS